MWQGKNQAQMFDPGVETEHFGSCYFLNLTPREFKWGLAPRRAAAPREVWAPRASDASATRPTLLTAAPCQHGDSAVMREGSHILNRLLPSAPSLLRAISLSFPRAGVPCWPGPDSPDLCYDEPCCVVLSLAPHAGVPHLHPPPVLSLFLFGAEISFSISGSLF